MGEDEPKTPIRHSYKPDTRIPGRNPIPRISWTYIAAPAIIAAAIGVLLAAILIPPHMIGQPKGLAEADRLKALNDLRGIFLQAAGGTALILGLLFTWRNFALSREGQITDRFTRAVAQLGEQSLAVRTGAIYALERIAQDSTRDRGAIIDTLATFVRERRSHHLKLDGTPIEQDVQAVLTVLGRRSGVDREQFALDLSHCDLHGGIFDDGDWRGASFVYSRLDDCWFTRAHVDGAKFFACSLEESGFVNATAEGVSFTATKMKTYMCGARLKHADFSQADCSETDFGGRYSSDGKPITPPANVAGANFTKAKLTGVVLEGVDLSATVGLTREQIESALTNERTVLPGGLYESPAHPQGPRHALSDQRDS